MSLRLTAIAAPLLAVLAACQAPPARVASTSGGGGDPQVAAFCRQRAEEVFNAQNRSARIQSDNRDTPFSGSFVSGVTNRGLSDRFAMDQMVSDCMRNNANRQTGPDGDGVQPGASAAAARPAAAPARALAQPGSGTPPLQPASANAPPTGAPLDRAPPPPSPVR